MPSLENEMAIGINWIQNESTFQNGRKSFDAIQNKGPRFLNLKLQSTVETAMIERRANTISFIRFLLWKNNLASNLQNDSPNGNNNKTNL
jgi:hypothetical protein